jgi:hypothetical protein
MTQEHGQVPFGTSTIDYRVERSSRRRTVTIAVDASEVILKAPEETSTERLRDVIRSRAPWILQRIMEFDAIGPAPPPMEFVSGESCAYLGRHYRLKIDRIPGTVKPQAALRGAFLVVQVEREMGSEKRRDHVERAVTAWYRKQAERRLPERVKLYAARAGLECPPVLIRNQEKRWGSCSSKGELRFNWRIIMAPMSLVDYVVAHEVCHLVVRDHSAAFWKLLTTIMPDYEVRRDRLRVEGLSYRT